MKVIPLFASRLKPKSTMMIFISHKSCETREKKKQKKNFTAYASHDTRIQTEILTLRPSHLARTEL